MFFTRVGMIVAWLVCAFGVMRIAPALAVLLAPESFPNSARFIGGGTGEAIDKGLLAIVVGIALGVLVEISQSLRSPSR